MTYWIPHDRADESPEAKARWWPSFSLAERMDLFVAFTNLILASQPDIADKRHARSITGRIQVLRKA
jgi:hypothetical protein